MLQYGFVVAENELNLSYDHSNKHQIRVPQIKIRELESQRCPTIARWNSEIYGNRCSTPILEYLSDEFSEESKQSAFYAFDNLTNKNIVPVFMPQSREFKDLNSVLSGDEQEKFVKVVAYLRKKYIKLEKRHPDPNFMNVEPSFSSSEISLSEDEIIELFGRLPKLSDSHIPTLRDRVSYIPDKFGSS